LPFRAIRHCFPVLLALCLSACLELSPVTDKPSTAREPDVIEIMPPSGVSPPMARLLAASLAEAMVDHGASVRLNEGTPPSGDARMVVTGVAVSGDTAGDGRVATLDWQVHGRNQAVPVTTVRLPVYGEESDWAYGSPALIRSIGERTMALLSDALGLVPESTVPPETATVYESETAVAEPTIQEVSAEPQAEPESVAPPTEAPQPVPAREPLPPPRLWVDEVTGSPGDGNRALTRALVELLHDAGYPLARTPSSAEYYVQAVVDVSVIDSSTETVEIVWSIVGRDGEEKGKITQRNEIPRGMLHEKWGETAHYAALGGFEGVRAILHELGYDAPEP